jgi:hypothetical protein
MATKKKVVKKVTKAVGKKKASSSSCRPTFKISKAGHLLKVEGNSQAASILSREGKAEKNKRKKRGCLNGTAGTFKLTDKQKRKLPKNLQKAILAYHKRQGKRIIS